MANEVKFKRGTSAQYHALTPDSHTFYFTTDDNQFYIGGVRLSNATDLTELIARVTANEVDIQALKDAVDILNGDVTVPGSVKKQIKDAIDALEAQLAVVAKTGAAEDVSVADADGVFTGTNVEQILKELYVMIGSGGTENAVTVTKATTPDADYLTTYIIKQGTTEVGRISIPKDLVVTSGQVVVDPVGQPAGTYLQLNIANQLTPVYINVADLGIVYKGSTGTTITTTVVGDVIGAEVNDGSITSVKLATDSVATNKIIEKNVTKDKLSQPVQDSLDLADTAVQEVVEGTVNGAISVDGVSTKVHGLGTAAYKNEEDFDEAGAADAVKGTATDGADAITVYGTRKAIAQLATEVDNLDVADTEVDGSVVTAVSQADGKITVTRKALPSVTDTAIAGEYVSEVDQTNGKITVTRAELPTVNDTAVVGSYVSEVDQNKGTISVTRVALPTVTDTAVAGSYVSKVSQDKGEISVTRTELPTVADTAVAGSYVSQVKQTKGEIEVTRAALPSVTIAETAGQYISAITQTNGLISVTKKDLPDVTDTAVEKKYVSAVSQTDGKITVTREDLPELEWGEF